MLQQRHRGAEDNRAVAGQRRVALGHNTREEKHRSRGGGGGGGGGGVISC